jgi:hypothetical protein
MAEGKMSTAPILTAESVRGLPTEAKQQLLALLARDLLASSCAPISVHDAAGEVVVYVVPPDARARAERAMREATPTRLAELRHRAATPENSFSVEEVLESVDSPADQTR